MLRTGIYLQVSEQRGAQTDGSTAESTRSNGKPALFRLGSYMALLTRGERADKAIAYARVDDDDVVTAVHVGRVAGLVLASEDLRDLRCKTSQYLIRSVDDDPFLGHRRSIGRDSLVA